MNKEVNRINLDKIDIPVDSVLLFETDLNKWNAVGALKDFTMAKHGNYSYIAFCDGHVKEIKVSSLKGLVWKPGKVTLDIKH